MKILKIESPLQIDLNIKNTFKAFLCFLPNSKIERNYWLQDKSLVFSSVRSAFHCYLETMKYEKDSEIIMSGISIPDMKSIVENHGLKVVACDLLKNSFRIDIDDLKKKITSRTRVIVVSQLLGSVEILIEVTQVAIDYDLRLIEDCAQCFDGSYEGSRYADMSLFSFGPIKLNTAMAGALLVSNDTFLKSKLKKTLNSYDEYSNIWYLNRLIKYFLLSLLLKKPLYGLCLFFSTLINKEYEDFLKTFSKSFKNNNNYSNRLPPPAIKFLMHRLNAKNIQKYINRKKINTQLSNPSKIKLNIDFPNQWVIAGRSTDPKKTSLVLRKRGISASSNTASLALMGENLPNAEKLMSELIFISTKDIDHKELN